MRAISRVALVTGASSGFGQATAALLAAQGFQVHIKVSLVEPTLFRTKFDPQPPATPLAVYESARQSMMRFVRAGVEQGPDPEQVARRIVQLATSSAPPLRSYVGPRASLLVALRHWLPQRIFEQVRRRVFQIQRVPGFDGKAHPVRN